MRKRLIRTLIAGASVAAVSAQLLYLGSNSIYNKLVENVLDADSCYLSGEDAGLPVTRADVDCDRVVIGTGSSARLIVPQKGNDCPNYMQKGEDGICEYFPPEYSG